MRRLASAVALILGLAAPAVADFGFDFAGTLRVVDGEFVSGPTGTIDLVPGLDGTPFSGRGTVVDDPDGTLSLASLETTLFNFGPGGDGDRAADGTFMVGFGRDFDSFHEAVRPAIGLFDRVGAGRIDGRVGGALYFDLVHPSLVLGYPQVDFVVQFASFHDPGVVPEPAAWVLAMMSLACIGVDRVIRKMLSKKGTQ